MLLPLALVVVAGSHEIASWKLIRLWIAEESIPTKNEQGYALETEVEAKKNT
nr:putative late blight resistance protein homolog R1B-8 [Ipomoea batatas]